MKPEVPQGDGLPHMQLDMEVDAVGEVEPHIHQVEGGVEEELNGADEDVLVDVRGEHSWALVPYVARQEVTHNAETDRPVFGPEIPPEMMWARLFKSMMPALLARTVPLSVRVPPIQPVVLSKRS